jgi:hypothetical protein
MADIQTIDIGLVREFTGAEKAKKENFRFFRYSQDYPSDLDYGNEEGKAGGSKHTRISGIQLQTFAKCLIDFFDYDLNDIKYDANLNDAESIQNKFYKGSSLSATVGEIQSGRGKPGIASVSKELKLQIIKRYRPNYAKGKTDTELLSEVIELEQIAAEQVGVIGPVTYNFIVRQAIYQWFKNTYLNDQSSFLSKSLPILDSYTWQTTQVDENLKYSIFVSSVGQPKNKPYPTICAIFDIDGEVNDADVINRAKDAVDSLLLRDTSSLVKENIYSIEKAAKIRDEEPTRVCVYADLAEVLYCPMTAPNLAVIDMIKAGISYLHQHPVEFSKTPDVDSTTQTIRRSIVVPSSKFNGLDDKIDSETFYFTTKPQEDMQDMLIKDAVLFGLTQQTDTIYTKPYELVLQDLLSTHYKYTNEIAARLESERRLKKNVLLRTYPSAPFNENVKFYYDKNYNLLAASFRKNATKPKTEVPVDDGKCITIQNNINLTIPNIEGEESILDYLTENTYTKLNDQTVLFITEFFIREYAIPSDIYTDNKDLYNKIKADIQKDINDNWAKNLKPEEKEENPIVKNTKKIPPKQDLFLESDYSRIKVDYLYVYNKNFLLEEDAEDPTATLQLVKLKSSNFWTNVLDKIPNEQASLDGFLRKHYPYLKHDSNPPPSTDKEKKKEPEIPKVKFERLKTEKLSIPNQIDLSDKLKIDDLLSGDCFAALIGLLNRKFPDASNLIKQIDSIFTIINSLDWCYLINLALNEKNLSLGDLIKKLSSDDEETQKLKQSISDSMDAIQQCIPPKPPEHVGDISKSEDAFRVPCELLLFNYPKIPYLFSADFLQILKRMIIEFITQLILELIIQALNQLIDKIKRELCKPNDKTASALVKTPKPKKLPIYPAPDDVSGPSGCSIVELLSVNPSISKNQIYSVTRSYFNCEEISNSEFEVYFSGLSTILETQEVIDLFSNNITEQLFSIIKNYSSKKEFLKFSKLVFNLSTTSNFFRFLSKYVDLFPCYEQLANDLTDPNYCFDPPREQGQLSNEEILAEANNLLGQITDLCASINGNTVADKIKSPVMLDEEAKKAISSGIQNIISSTYNNFSLVKKNSLNSFETIKIFNDMIGTFQMSKINKTVDYKKNNSLYADSFTDILFENGKTSKLFDAYNKAVVLRKSNLPVGGTKNYRSSVSVVSIGSSIFKTGEEIVYNNKILYTDSIQIIPKTTITNETKTSISTKGAFSLSDYKVEEFSNIFFDDARFKNIYEIGEEKAKEVKNYYYVYNNLLDNSRKTNVVEDLKKYKEVKEELERFIYTEQHPEGEK